MPELSVNHTTNASAPSAATTLAVGVGDDDDIAAAAAFAATAVAIEAVGRPREVGGPAGLEPTRYGDWEKSGRCIDF